MNVTCTSETCDYVLNSKCVFYEGMALPYAGINTNDSLETALQKINEAIQDITVSASVEWGDITGLLGNQSDLIAYFNNFTPITRVLTINGVSYDLSADRSWTVGGGDVSKVGTPADNQIGVWTGDGTIEGTSGLTYNGSNLQLTGDIGSTGTRITKGWFTDLQVTNAIAGSITGSAPTLTTGRTIGTATGDVTSAGSSFNGSANNTNAYVLDKTAITGKTLVTATGSDHVLIADASDSDNLKKVLVSDFGGGSSTLAGLSDVSLSTPLTTQFLQYDGADWVNAYFSNPVITPTIVANAYTLQATDQNKILHIDNGYTNVTITLPDGLATNFSCTIVHKGTGGIITLVADTTLESYGTTIEIPDVGATVYHQGSNIWTALGALGAASGGITNGAANTELMMSNGTNAIASGIFATAATGSITLGSGSITGNRIIDISSSSPDASITVKSKGAGGIVLQLQADATLASIETTTADSGWHFGISGSATTNQLISRKASDYFGIITENQGANTVDSGRIVITTGDSGTSTDTNSGSISLDTGASNGTGKRGNISLFNPSLVLANWQGMEKGLFINNILTEPSTAIANGMAIYSVDDSAESTLGLYLEKAVASDAALVATHSLRVKINGTIYKLMLATP